MSSTTLLIIVGVGLLIIGVVVVLVVVPGRSKKTSSPPPPSPLLSREDTYWILCCKGQLNQRIYLLDEELTIGRRDDCDICYYVNSPAVSRNHARIEKKENSVYITDCNSSAGTFIDQRGRIPGNTPVILNVGDSFYIGSRDNKFLLLCKE